MLKGMMMNDANKTIGAALGRIKAAADWLDALAAGVCSDEPYYTNCCNSATNLHWAASAIDTVFKDHEGWCGHWIGQPCACNQSDDDQADALSRLSDENAQLREQRDRLAALIKKVRDSFLHDDDEGSGLIVCIEAEYHHFDEMCAAIKQVEESK